MNRQIPTSNYIKWSLLCKTMANLCLIEMNDVETLLCIIRLLISYLWWIIEVGGIKSKPFLNCLSFFQLAYSVQWLAAILCLTFILTVLQYGYFAIKMFIHYSMKEEKMQIFWSRKKELNINKEFLYRSMFSTFYNYS